MTVTVELKVLQLLCARLCHDLAGPVGAISNGMELVREPGEVPDPEAMDLIAGSARELSDRLQFQRVAFGLAPGMARAAAEARSLAVNLFSSGRVELDWPLPDGHSDLRFSEPGAKLLLNLILIGSECLPRGGTLSVELEPTANALVARIVAQGEGAALSEEMRSALAGSVRPDDLTPRSVQGYFAGRLAESAGVEVAFDAGTTGQLGLVATLPG